MRRQVAALDPQLALFDVRAMTTLVEENVAQPRLTALLVGLFAGIALLLAALGVYGLSHISSRSERGRSVFGWRSARRQRPWSAWC